MLTIWTKRRLPRSTVVFESFWRFAAERQRIYRSRVRGEPEPFTSDPILREFKFTNAYRASDRTSQYLLRHVIHDRDRPWRDTFFRIVLFKLFNRIETWVLFEDSLGDLTTDGFDVARFGQVLDRAMERGDRVYSAAYIMPPVRALGSGRKHHTHLRLLELMLEEQVDERVASATSMDAAFDVLASYPSIGPFLGYQLITDLNYSPYLDFNEDSFVVPGPGALDGLAKCFDDLGDLTPPDVIRWVAASQHEQFRSRGIEFADLWGRSLQLIDCQNLFCEIDKYARVAHPNIAGRSGRSRIKQRFAPSGLTVPAWFPPKWGINQAVRRWLSRADAVQS